MEKKIKVVNLPEGGVSRYFGPNFGVLQVHEGMPHQAKEIGLAKAMPYFEEVPAVAEESATAPAKKKLDEGKEPK